MSEFDKIIGYETIKNELQQVCDMIQNKEVYENLGAKLPHGILLYGDPGLGKTLMAKCFIDESGLNAYTVRRNKGSDGFIEEITETFKKAKENSPAIRSGSSIFLCFSHPIARQITRGMPLPKCWNNLPSVLPCLPKT